MKLRELFYTLFLAVGAMASQWETYNSGNLGVELSLTDTVFGGTFSRSPDFHYVADTRIGGRLRRTDCIIAYGRVQFSVAPGFNSAVQLGHFESYGGHPAHTDFVGIRFMEHSPGRLRAQACVNLNRGGLRVGPALVLPAGDYEWHYEWNPTGGAHRLGSLRVLFRGPARGVSEVQLGPDSANFFFACNAFGLHSGYQQGSAPQPAEILVTEAQYTCLPTPDGTRPPTRVFLLIGQSNARGTDSSVNALQLVMPRLENVYIYTDQWTFASAPTEPRNYFGPEIALGRELSAIYREPVAIIKVTAPPATLAEEWLPELDLSYARLVETTRTALSSLRAPILSGVFSVQGESDSGSWSCAQSYAANLNRLHRALRAEFNSPHLPLIVSRLMPFIQTPYRDAVRSAQQGFLWIDTDDLGHIGDSLHYNGSSLVQIGERLARRYISMRAIPYPPANPGGPVRLR